MLDACTALASLRPTTAPLVTSAWPVWTITAWRPTGWLPSPTRSPTASGEGKTTSAWSRSAVRLLCEAEVLCDLGGDLVRAHLRVVDGQVVIVDGLVAIPPLQGQPQPLDVPQLLRCLALRG